MSKDVIIVNRNAAKIIEDFECALNKAIDIPEIYFSSTDQQGNSRNVIFTDRYTEALVHKLSDSLNKLKDDLALIRGYTEANPELYREC